MQRLNRLSKIIFFFLLGAGLTVVVIISSGYIILSSYFQDRIYPGVKIGDIDYGEKTLDQVESSFPPSFNHLIITLESSQATVSATASDIGLTIDAKPMANRAFSIGRQTDNPYYNLLQILSAKNGSINLPLEIHLNETLLHQKLEPLSLQIEKPAKNAVFNFNPQAGPDNKGRVVAFVPSENGLEIDRGKISQEIIARAKNTLTNRSFNNSAIVLKIPLYTKTVFPDLQSSTADEMGIKTLLGTGQSYFFDSIPGRVYNIGLGTEKVSGRLIAPDEIFSFNQSIGTISAIFGFQKAYSIVKGKTVLDDGGGVCQVSTTLYRAVLNAGLPVIERVGHAYRVGFYEQGGFKPGLDATVYPPSPDFKFKNDSGNWLLLQARFDKVTQSLTFDIFGTNDGRKTTIVGPFFVSTSPPPDPVFEDDPTLPLGEVKQVDTAHPGAKVYFKRSVIRNEETLINETVTTNYIPWPSRFLRGTKT